MKSGLLTTTLSENGAQAGSGKQFCYVFNGFGSQTHNSDLYCQQLERLKDAIAQLRPREYY